MGAIAPLNLHYQWTTMV